MSDDSWRIDVTDDDVAGAKQAWMRARDSGADADRVDLLRADLERLWRAQAKQLVEALQRSGTSRLIHRGEPDPTGRTGPGSGSAPSA